MYQNRALFQYKDFMRRFRDSHYEDKATAWRHFPYLSESTFV